MINAVIGRSVRVHAADPEFRAGDCALKFTLTFEGVVKTGGAKAERKHARRRIFHGQLKRLWETNLLLKNWALPIDEYHAVPAVHLLAQKHAKFGEFRFVPLITRDLSVEAALHFHILRPTTFKGSIADPDNIVKILIDSLKMPQDAGDLGNGAIPFPDEIPFFVLMQDDGLLSKISSTTDELLQPILGKDHIEQNETRVIIDVYIRPNFPNNSNLIFFSDDFEVWNHQWASSMDGIRNWSDAELKARTTQCVLRMRATASNFQMQRMTTRNTRYDESLSDEERKEAWYIEIERSRAQSDEEHIIWNSQLRPIALAMKEELQRRIYGEPPYPDPFDRMHAIAGGMLTGPDPIGEAAAGLESLMRQLP